MQLKNLRAETVGKRIDIIDKRKEVDTNEANSQWMSVEKFTKNAIGKSQPKRITNR